MTNTITYTTGDATLAPPHSMYLLPTPRTPDDRAHINEAGVPRCGMQFEPGITLLAYDWLCAYRLCEECERQRERAGEWKQEGLFEGL